MSYRALNTNGDVVTGSIADSNLRTAARKLRGRGLRVISLNETDAQKKIRHNSLTSRRPAAGDIVIFLRQLYVLIKSGIPMDEAVESLHDSAGHPFLCLAAEKISRSLRRGGSFSKALIESGIKLPSYFYPLIEAGELTGNLGSALHDGISQWEYELQTRKKLVQSLTYPAILVVSGIIAVMLMSTVVVPRFVKILDRSHVDIPLLARIVLESGRFFNDNFWTIILICAAAAAGTALFLSKKKNRQYLWDMSARLPFIGDWLTEADIGRWAAMLATLLENRVELINALELASRNVSLTFLRIKFRNIINEVRNGTGIADALNGLESINSAGLNLVRVGEKAGELPSMLRSLASLMDSGAKNRMERFLLLVEPAAILVIGAMIGLIMAGIILAITSVNSISI